MEEDEIIVLYSNVKNIKEYQPQIVSVQTGTPTGDRDRTPDVEILGNGPERCSVIKYVTKTSERYFLNADQHYFCQFCETTFRVESDYNHHFLIPKDKEPVFKCEQCGKNFGTTAGLSAHNRIHTENRVYKSKSHGNTFPMFKKQNQHKLSHTHTGEKPYKCGPTGNSFNHKTNLSRHRKTHTGLEPLLWCKICEKCFPTYQKFTHHKSRHPFKKPHLCEICGIRFSGKISLTIHKFSHTGEKPFICNLCGKGFSTPSWLSTHKKLHTMVKPYKCDECGQCYSTLSGVKRHKRQKHIPTPTPTPTPQNFYGYTWATPPWLTT